MTASSIEMLAEALRGTQLRLDAVGQTSSSARRLSQLIGRIRGRLSRPPRIALLGEFNTGKTTLANALIGADVLPTSILANTRIPLHVRYSAEPRLLLELPDRSRQQLGPDAIPLLVEGRARTLLVGLPIERLRSFELIDTPGLASGMTRLEGAYLEAARSAHIALWCTASNQAWKASEHEAWHAVPARLRRRSLLVATLADALNSPRERLRVEARLRSEAAPAFAGMVMVTAADIDELRRNPNTPDFDERWIAAGGAELDSALARMIELVWQDRKAATQRILHRETVRLEQAG